MDMKEFEQEIILALLVDCVQRGNSPLAEGTATLAHDIALAHAKYHPETEPVFPSFAHALYHLAGLGPDPDANVGEVKMSVAAIYKITGKIVHDAIMRTSLTGEVPEFEVNAPAAIKHYENIAFHIRKALE